MMMSEIVDKSKLQEMIHGQRMNVPLLLGQWHRSPKFALRANDQSLHDLANGARHKRSGRIS